MIATVKAETLRLTAPFMSTEEYRHYLCGVFITPHPTLEGVIAVATATETKGI